MKHSQFKELHDYCQTLAPKVSRNSIIEKLKSITGIDKIQTVIATLDTKVTRGYFLSASNTEHPLIKDRSYTVVVLARGLNDCWQRFVHVKEVMHLLDDDGELTDSAEKLEKLLNDFSSPPLEISPLGQSDWLGIWLALACFCPEKSRLEFHALLNENQIDNYGIALKLKIPEQHVPLLFRPRYLDIVKMLRGEL